MQHPLVLDGDMNIAWFCAHLTEDQWLCVELPYNGRIDETEQNILEGLATVKLLGA